MIFISYILMALQQIYIPVFYIPTRKLCYRKDDRAIRPIIIGALKIFGSS